MVATDTLQFAPYAGLSLAILALGLRFHRELKWRHLWLLLAITACVMALVTATMNFIALLAISAIGLCAWMTDKHRIKIHWRYFFGACTLLGTLALGLHVIPGFKALPIWEQVMLSENARPFSLYFGFDKALIALLLLGLCYQRPLTVLPWRNSFSLFLILAPLIIVITISLAVISNHIDFDPKPVPGLVFWIWANLLFTCTAEEAFFRGFIQHRLSQSMANIRYGIWIACGLGALLFGIAHLGGGWHYVALATIAGFGYGAIYTLTGRIELSIACHFLLNLMHILFFTYPALLPAG